MSPYQQTDNMLRIRGSGVLGILSSHVNVFLRTTSEDQWSLNKSSGSTPKFSSEFCVILLADLVPDPTFYYRPKVFVSLLCLSF